MNIGDKVAYSKEFCRNTDQMTGDIPLARGIIKELKPIGQTLLATIEWDKDVPNKVIVNNLVKIRDIPYE